MIEILIRVISIAVSMGVLEIVFGYKKHGELEVFAMTGAWR
jgi:hypothetical protein